MFQLLGASLLIILFKTEYQLEPRPILFNLSVSAVKYFSFLILIVSLMYLSNLFHLAERPSDLKIASLFFISLRKWSDSQGDSFKRFLDLFHSKQLDSIKFLFTTLTITR